MTWLGGVALCCYAVAAAFLLSLSWFALMMLPGILHLIP